MFMQKDLKDREPVAWGLYMSSLKNEVLKVGNSSQIFQVNHIVGPVTVAGKSQHNMVSFTTWLVLVKQTIS